MTSSLVVNNIAINSYLDNQTLCTKKSITKLTEKKLALSAIFNWIQDLDRNFIIDDKFVNQYFSFMDELSLANINYNTNQSNTNKKNEIFLLEIHAFLIHNKLLSELFYLIRYGHIRF